MKTLKLRLDEEGLKQLKEMRAVWPKVICAQQSNIVRDAVDFADTSAELQEPPRSFAISQNISPTEQERLAQLADAWQYLSRYQRETLIAEAEDVAGV